MDPTNFKRVSIHRYVFANLHVEVIHLGKVSYYMSFIIHEHLGPVLLTCASEFLFLGTVTAFKLPI